MSLPSHSAMTGGRGSSSGAWLTASEENSYIARRLRVKAIFILSPNFVPLFCWIVCIVGVVASFVWIHFFPPVSALVREVRLLYLICSLFFCFLGQFSFLFFSFFLLPARWPFVCYFDLGPPISQTYSITIFLGISRVAKGRKISCKFPETFLGKLS